MYVVMDQSGPPRVGITELGGGNKPIQSSIDMKQTVIEFSDRGERAEEYMQQPTHPMQAFGICASKITNRDYGQIELPPRHQSKRAK